MTDVTKFINKETGEIYIGEVVIGPDTKWEDIERLAPYAEVDADDEVCCLTMKEKLVAANIPVQESLKFLIMLLPVLHQMAFDQLVLKNP